MALYQSELLKVLEYFKMWGNFELKEEISICMLGVQKILVKKDLCKTLDRMQIDYSPDLNDMLETGKIDTYIFFKKLGYKNVHAIDFSDYEGADIIYDLNKPLPEKYETFDVVLNIGTLEHIYNVPLAMDSILLLAKPNGIIFNICPAAGYVDHGFYSFSPCFFEDYYRFKEVTLLNLFIEIIQDNRTYENWRSFYTEDLRHFDDWEGQDGVNIYIDALRKVDGVGRAQIWSITRKLSECKREVGNYPIQRIYQELL